LKYSSGDFRRPSQLHPELATYFAALYENCANDTVDGLHWDYVSTIATTPDTKMTPTTTTLKPGTEYLFKSPLHSMMAILPVAFWDVTVREINRYAAQKIKTQVEKKVSK
jgi:hypothetical protein